MPVKFQMVADSTTLIESYDLDIDDLIAISFHNKKEIAFRAAWMLEYLMKYKPAKFCSYIDKILMLLPNQENPSAMRHFTKIVSLLTDKKADPIYIKIAANTDFESVIELLFTRLVDPKTLVATKVHCMQALANLMPRYDWIKEELIETIDHLTEIESIAFFARAKMVKKQMRKYC